MNNLGIKIEFQKEELVLVSIYRNPHGDEENRKLLNLTKEISGLDSEYKVICGDFNMPGTNLKFWMVKDGSDKFCYNFILKIKDCYLNQYVDEVTRFRDGSMRNMLNLIFSNEEYFINVLAQK